MHPSERERELWEQVAAYTRPLLLSLPDDDPLRVINEAFYPAFANYYRNSEPLRLPPPPELDWPARPSPQAVAVFKAMREVVPPLVRALPADTVLRTMTEAPAPGWEAYYLDDGAPPP